MSMTIAGAKIFLEEQGYYTTGLWHVGDVKSMFNCDNDEAQYVLDQAINNEATMEQIWFNIEKFGEIEELKRKEV